MSLDNVHIAALNVSRLIIGGNPFSGGSHQGIERNRDMRDYYTVARIKQTLRQAEQLGITTFIGRADHHITRLLAEYWNEGGTIQWIAQTCPEYISMTRSVQEAVDSGARAVYLHGGHMDNLLAQNQLDVALAAIAQIRRAGLPAGIAGHNPQVFEWAEHNADVDFYMCSYYNPISRAGNAEYVPASQEQYLAEDRSAMICTIKRLRKPAIHYKIFAAGRNDPAQAFAYVARHLRPGDAVCFGVFTKDNPNMIADNITLFEQAMAER